MLSVKKSIPFKFEQTLRSMREALSFTSQHKLWHYYVPPALITLALWVGVFLLAWNLMGWLSEQIMEYTKLTERVPEQYHKLVYYTLHLGLKLALASLVAHFFSFWAQVFVSALSIFVSEKAYCILRNQPVESHFLVLKFFKEVLKNLRSYFLKQLPVNILLFALSLIFPPVVILSLLFNFYMTGNSLTDDFIYLNNKYKNTSADAKSIFSKTHRLTFGAMAYLLMLIPFVGLIIAPGFAGVSAAILNHKIETEA